MIKSNNVRDYGAITTDEAEALGGLDDRGGAVNQRAFQDALDEAGRTHVPIGEFVTKTPIILWPK